MQKKQLIRKYVTLLLIIFVEALLAGLLNALLTAFSLGNSFWAVLVVAAGAGGILMSATCNSTAMIAQQDSQIGFSRIEQVIQKWGWRQRTKTEQFAIYQPPAVLSTLMDNLSVSLLPPSTVRLTGPEPIVSLLRTKLSKI